MTYDFLKGDTDGEYFLEESSEGYLSRFNVSYKLSYGGKLAVYSSADNKMTISYPLMSNNYIQQCVFDTQKSN